MFTARKSKPMCDWRHFVLFFTSPWSLHASILRISVEARTIFLNWASHAPWQKNNSLLQRFYLSLYKSVNHWCSFGVYVFQSLLNFWGNQSLFLYLPEFSIWATHHFSFKRFWNWSLSTVFNTAVVSLITCVELGLFCHFSGSFGLYLSQCLGIQS